MLLIVAFWVPRVCAHRWPSFFFPIRLREARGSRCEPHIPSGVKSYAVLKSIPDRVVQLMNIYLEHTLLYRTMEGLIMMLSFTFNNFNISQLISGNQLYNFFLKIQAMTLLILTACVWFCLCDLLLPSPGCPHTALGLHPHQHQASMTLQTKQFT